MNQKSQKNTKTNWLVGLIVGLAFIWPLGSINAEEKTGSPEIRLVDLLIVAPHSDDEAIGCTVIMLRAIAQKKRVGIVIVTASDGFPKAAAALAKKNQDQLTTTDYFNLAALRQRHSLQALAKIGILPADLMFLGYPDSGLEAIYKTNGPIPFRQAYTKQDQTYASVVTDYHSQVHKQPAPYLKESIVADLAEIISTRKPKEIYVTDETDTHSDHRATFWFVRDSARTAGYVGSLYTFIVHGRPPVEPPTHRVVLTKSELETKRTILEIYQVGVSPVHDDLAEHYTKPEEQFWRVIAITDQAK